MKTWESLETLPMPFAGEALPWKLNGRGPECTHVPLFPFDCFVFKSGSGQGISVFLVTE